MVLQILREEKEKEEVQYLAYDKLCQCSVHTDPPQALNYCQMALNIKEEPRLFCEMGDAHIADEMYDEGEFIRFPSHTSEGDISLLVSYLM